MSGVCDGVMPYPDSSTVLSVLSCDEQGHSGMWSYNQTALRFCLCCLVMNKAIQGCDPLSIESYTFACVVPWWVRPFNGVMIYPESSITLQMLPSNEWRLAMVLSLIHIILPLYLFSCGKRGLEMVWFLPRVSTVCHPVVKEHFDDPILCPDSSKLCLVCHTASQASQWSTSLSKASYNFYKRVREVYFRKDHGPNSEQDPNSFNAQFE
jgi:hypothetical protein